MLALFAMVAGVLIVSPDPPPERKFILTAAQKNALMEACNHVENDLRGACAITVNSGVLSGMPYNQQLVAIKSPDEEMKAFWRQIETILIEREIQ